MAREIRLTQDQKALVDDEDFEQLSKHKWFAMWTGYSYIACRKASGKMVLMHRVILDAPPDAEVDHVDGDTLNNTRINIRLAPSSGNMINRRKFGRRGKKPGSKHKGVSWNLANSKWIARVAAEGQQLYLGYFYNEWQAAVEYNRAAAVLHGPFARLNKFK